VQQWRLQAVDLKEGQRVKVVLPPVVTGNVTPEEQQITSDEKTPIFFVTGPFQPE
jgi:predicted DNA-binding antitoxin AbrB/MazE fold protein